MFDSSARMEFTCYYPDKVIWSFSCPGTCLLRRVKSTIVSKALNQASVPVVSRSGCSTPSQPLHPLHPRTSHWQVAVVCCRLQPGLALHSLGKTKFQDSGRPGLTILKDIWLLSAQGLTQVAGVNNNQHCRLRSTGWKWRAIAGL